VSSAGRPLRFLGYLLGGWVGIRAMSTVGPVVWGIAIAPAPENFVGYRSVSDHGGALARAVTERPAMLPPVPPISASTLPMAAMGSRAAVLAPSPTNAGGWSTSTAELMLSSTLSFVQPRMGGSLIDRVNEIVTGSEGRAEGMAAAPIAPRMDATGRWSGTAWLLWRPETGGSVVQAPLLGGSQGGARIDYRLIGGRAGQLSLYGRASRAFTGPSSEEGALGLALRPAGFPVSLLAERRQRIGVGGRNGFALLAAGGVGPRDVARRVEVEGYAQAGIVGLPGSDGFADGKASLGYRLTPQGKVTLGGSISGSVQPGASRLDVGPELRLRLPMGQSALRLSTEWRTRIAGDARPASGPAVTLVTDF
jgi:hypothetical protein